ncbi:MgtC/SapB family protein [Microbacterium sp. STN6]|uniref:MgtC/SapB family protein n=1 Tax=Microbacterium sp. STN6 TaxID=2995588 RepID=UPI002260B0FA|nr:MgtC/SapB family protein [Microbacterium sp. STN6]MCX7521896.1 MgtC/SapB family protein [Microbacterium sp. STN6]
MRTATLATLGGDGWLQVGELMLAFLLASLIGLERELRHKSAGLRTQAIVGTTGALLMIVSKYGFTDVLIAGHIVLDPSRVAAQIVSCVGFLGAGLILTRRGAVRGLTTAAAVWESAAIGMAAGAGLWVLAIVVTALHFFITYVYTFVIRRIPGTQETAVQLEVVYVEGGGVLRHILASITDEKWMVNRLVPREHGHEGLTAVAVDLSGSAQPARLIELLGALDGVRGVQLLAEEELG